VVVDDLENAVVLRPVHGLGDLVVVHQDDLDVGSRIRSLWESTPMTSLPASTTGSDRETDDRIRSRTAPM